MTTDNARTAIKNVREKLLPLTPFVGFLERLLMLLPRRLLHADLHPVGDVHAVKGKQGYFEAIGPNPCFELRTEESVDDGWYYLEAALTRHSGNRNAKIYLDTGRGYSESDVIFVPSNLRGSIREVLQLPKGVKGLRWVPMNAQGLFFQSDLLIHKISAFEGYCRRAWRVYEDLGRLKAKPSDVSERASWWSLPFNIDAAYKWSAGLRLKKSSAMNYCTFIEKNDTLSHADFDVIRRHIGVLAQCPLISILMPIFNPPVEFFRAALESVLAQLYENWELCLADDASTNPEIRAIIEEFKKKTPRIKVVYRPVNGHISSASNSALGIATGDFVALMDHDDLIPRHALYHVVIEINRYPNVDLIYSDEDKIDEVGQRLDPYFKPDWNPDLFYSQNMFSHLGVYRTVLVREVGGFRVGYEGSQDYDLALRCSKKTSPDRIRHIPRVLYHWRIHTGSTALATSEKSYAQSAGVLALRGHFVDAEVDVCDGLYSGSYRVRYPLPQDTPLVSLIIPTRDQVFVLKKCIDGILHRTDYQNFEILVVDNQSEERETRIFLRKLREDRRVRILNYGGEFNYSAINNYAAKQAKGSVLCLMNNDVEVIDSAWLSEMVSHAIRDDIGAVGAKLLYPDNRVQHAGVIIGLGGVANHAHTLLSKDSQGYFGRASVIQNFSAVTAACLVVQKEKFFKANMLDDENLTVAFNDVDLCLKLQSIGYRNLYTPFALLYHHESLSRGSEDTPEKRMRFASEESFMIKKWSIDGFIDRYYNPNLTNALVDFSLGTHKVRSMHHGYPLKVD